MFTDKARLAAEQGIVSYDTALPQQWLDETVRLIAQATGEASHLIYDDLGEVVWAYRWTSQTPLGPIARDSVWGEPVAIGPAGRRLLDKAAWALSLGART